MNKQKHRWLGTAILILILLSTAWGCGPTPTPTPELTTEPQEEPPAPELTEPSTTPTPSAPPTPGIPPEDQRRCKEESEEGRAEQEKTDGHEFPPYLGLMYVPGQVIVSGPGGEVDKLVELLPLGEMEDELSLLPLDQILEQLSLLSREEIEEELGLLLLPSEEIEEELRLLPLEQIEKLDLSEGDIARLYTMDGESSVEEIVCLINALGSGKGVAGDPNYYLSPAGEWAGAASPWTQNGGWTDGVDGGGRGIADADAFEVQWALGPWPGIGLYDDNGQRIGTETDGAGIRVGVFDTSPFDSVTDGVTAKIDLDRMWSEKQVKLADAHKSWTLGVSHPPLPPAPTCPVHHETGDSLEDQDISSHGLFVAGLVHAVAPGSEIHLVRVLENDGCGSLFSIAKEIQDFVVQAMWDVAKDQIQGVVLNLSLGIHHPRDPKRFGLPEAVASLHSMLRWIAPEREEGEEDVIIVAAAGNDSYAEPADAPRGMELPAADELVIGVAASNAQGQRGCFSNYQPNRRPRERNVAAPGGDGEGEGECHLPQCDAENPKACLVSLSYQSNTGYVYWVGTSFAAPLVTGQVALNFGSSCLAPGNAWADPIRPYLDIIDLGASCPP